MPTSEIVLYQYRGNERLPSLSPPCLKVFLALKRLGAPHRVVDIGPLQVKRYSPSGRVPAIEMDGKSIADSCAILDALNARFPAADLWPAEPSQRITDTLWDHFVTDTLYWGGVVLRYLVPENREAAWDLFFGKGFSLRRLVMGPLIVREVRSRARGQGIGLRPPDDVRRAYAGWLRLIDDGLAGGPFLQGRSVPGRGDLAVASHVAQLVVARDAMPGIAALLERTPRLAPHVSRVFEACGVPDPGA